MNGLHYVVHRRIRINQCVLRRDRQGNIGFFSISQQPDTQLGRVVIAVERSMLDIVPDEDKVVTAIGSSVIQRNPIWTWYPRGTFPSLAMRSISFETIQPRPVLGDVMIRFP